MANVALQELRIGFRQTGSTTFDAANTGAWSISNASANCIKLRITKIDKSGLKADGIADETLQTRLGASPPALPGMRGGSLKVTTYLGGGSAPSMTADAYSNVLSHIFGSMKAPLDTKTFLVGAGSNASNIVCTSANAKIANGQGVLIGGEARIATNVQSGYFLINMALASAPAENTNCAIAHSVYFDETASNSYFDLLAIGKSTTDQRQCIGCQSGVTFSGMAPGEAPKMDLDFKVLDHQVVPVAERTTLTYSSTGSGNDPPTGKTFGHFLFGDSGEQVAKQAVRAAQFSINPGIEWTPLADLNGPFGNGGWVRNKFTTKAEFTAAIDEDHLGLIDDFNNQTSKQLLLQLGTEQGKTVAFYFPKFYIDNMPTEAALNNEVGLKISGHGDENYTASDELLTSSLSVHYF